MNTHVGYNENVGFVFIIVFIILSLIVNMIFNVLHVIKKIINKTKKNVFYIEHILFILSIAETLISFFWLLSVFIFKNIEKTSGCRALGFFQTFAYFFDWILTGCSIYHLRNIILGVSYFLKAFKKIIIYVIISLVISLAVAIISISLDSIGKSPMNSCFLSVDNDSDSDAKNIIIIFFIFTPIYMLIFLIVSFFSVISSQLYKNDTENKAIFNGYIKFSLVNLIISSLMTILFIIDLASKEYENLDWFICIITIIICLNPLILGILHLKEARFFKFSSNNMSSYNIEKKRDPLLTSNELKKELNIEKFENVAIKKFVMNIYIAVCYCLEKAIYREEKECEINQDNCNKINKYNISKKNISEEAYINKLEKDVLIKSREDFIISCVEYAPEIFAYLRNLDGVKEVDILNSMLPMNNKICLKDSEGRGGSFFINSDDNEYSIKTITSHEAELLKGRLLLQLAEHISENNDSIIGRLYGMYKISDTTGNELYFMLMKNVIGSFNENLICKYDLKGSSLNRKTKVGEYMENVMKDNNFKEVEQVILINKKNADKLKNITKEDANFFAKAEIMDYSLLVAKISLNKNEMDNLFGKHHRRETEIEYFQIAGINRETLQITNNSLPKESILENNSNKEIKNNDYDNNETIRYNKNKLEPLKKYFFPSLKGDVLYIISIIDFLQEYNLNKNLETKLKMIKTGAKEKEISSVPPEKYKDRFIEFVESITDIENYVKGLTDPTNKDDFQ